MWEDEDMPIDQWGNRADIIMDGDSRIKRMNLGGFYEPFLNASARDTSERIRQMFGMEPKGEYTERQVRDVLNAAQKSGGGLIEKSMDYLMKFYQMTSINIYRGFMAMGERFNAVQHLTSVLLDGIYNNIPPDNELDNVEMVENLMQHYPPNIGPVTYRGRSGRLVTTKAPVLIGSLYVIALEKTGTDWSGVSSAKLQVHGIPAKRTNADKYSSPGSPNPVRLTGEDENRLFVATIGSEATADIADQSNNPKTHKEILRNIYKAEKPTDIQCVVDRKLFKTGSSRALLYVNHMLECSGIKFIDESRGV